MSTMIDRAAFGAQLKAAMDGQGLRYRPVAELIGVSPAQISRAVNGQPIDAGATVALALAFGLPLLDLFDDATKARLARVMVAQRQAERRTEDGEAEAMKVLDCSDPTGKRSSEETNGEAKPSSVSPQVSRETSAVEDRAA
ncbi:MAG: helix-turn-helix transcriptional regulator [Pseudomonadota bacterium]